MFISLYTLAVCRRSEPVDRENVSVTLRPVEELAELPWPAVATAASLCRTRGAIAPPSVGTSSGP